MILNRKFILCSNHSWVKVGMTGFDLAMRPRWREAKGT
jgi:hypothetical protein